MPKRGKRLPTVPGWKDMQKLFDAAESLRDRLLLGLMYGCGLKPGEVCRLRWRDVDPARRSLSVRTEPLAPDRELLLPTDLLPILAEGKNQCEPDHWIFPGFHENKHLSPRTVGLIVQTLAREADIVHVVSPMTLRHSYAVHCLETGMNIRELQEYLGHKNVETTMRYYECMRPEGFVSPLDRLNKPEANQEPAPEHPRHDALPVEFPPDPNLPSDPLPTPREVGTSLPLELLLNPGNPVKSFLSLLKTRLKSTFTSIRRPGGAHVTSPGEVHVARPPP